MSQARRHYHMGQNFASFRLMQMKAIDTNHFRLRTTLIEESGRWQKTEAQFIYEDLKNPGEEIQHVERRVTILHQKNIESRT